MSSYVFLVQIPNMSIYLQLPKLLKSVSFLRNSPVIKTRNKNSYIKNSYFRSNLLVNMVEPGGIEPPTSCVQGRRSPS